MADNETRPGVCQRCHEPIDPAQARKYPNCPPLLHIECAIRTSVGSEAHQAGLCSCYGGLDGCGDPEEGETLRDAARRAFRAWRLGGRKATSARVVEGFRTTPTTWPTAIAGPVTSSRTIQRSYPMSRDEMVTLYPRPTNG
jgi:hypothetical protein